MKLGSQARSFGQGIYPNEDDFLSTVRQVGKLGFAGIEANWKNMERYFDCPDVFHRKLDDVGLELIGAHYGGALSDPSTRDQMLSDLRRIAPFVSAVGGSFVVCSGHRAQAESAPQDAWERMADRLHELGDICTAEGVQVAYHNHWWESEDEGLSKLAELTNPAKVSFAFDTGHHTRAGQDAAKAIRELGTRLTVVHLADYAPEAEDIAHRPPLGEGVLDMEAVKGALDEVGFTSWLVLEEQTEQATAREHVSKCMNVLRRFCN